MCQFNSIKLLEQGVVVKLKDSNFKQGQVTNPEARCRRENIRVLGTRLIVIHEVLLRGLNF